MSDTRTDEEVICGRMEKYPGPWGSTENCKWWTSVFDTGPMPIALDLDALREVEEILSKEQRLDYWVALVTGVSGPLDKGYWRLIHASAEQKIKALAAVLRKEHR